MTAYLQMPFALNSVVYHVKPTPTETYALCPDCAGSKTVIMVCNSGESFLIACRTCSAGIEPSSGYIKKTVYQADVEKVTLRTVALDYDGKFVYSPQAPDATCKTILRTENLFESEVLAKERAVQVTEKLQQESDQRILYSIASNRRDNAWTVSYWRDRIRRLKKELEVAEKYLHKISQENKK